MASLLFFPSQSFGQDTSGKKLEVSEKSSPEKMDNKKIRTSKRRKAKGNPNRGSNKVIVINPFKWDWDKVMWFKARKSDYETKDYNPDKRPKRQTYDNKPNYKSADRKAITNPSKLEKPLIPYDSRIADEGPVLQKKRKPKNVNLQNGGPQDSPKLINLNDPSETLSKAPKKDKRSKADGKKLYSKGKDKDRKAFDNDKLETASVPDLDPKMDDDKIMFRKKKEDYAKMDNDKLMVSEHADYKSNKPDGDKLMTVEVKDGKRNKFDDKKLMISEPANRERKPFDDSKLMTAQHGDRDRKPFDDDKLMTATPANPDRKKFDNDKLMTATVNKPKKQDLHDDRLLTVLERKKPTDEMKETSKEISKLEGDYQRHFYVTSESHPGTKLLAAENTKVPFLAKTFQTVSLFFSSIWTDNTQPNYVTRKKRKEKRDKNEGQIWDNSVHPNEWKKQEAESGEQHN
ncbi:hypothetical protein MATR_33620 [Marivirga tractuosa]|uniref:Uncharacterized protein n=2 Tax=Marivirga TaxID=869806 RepID=E4TRU3_MARTH|nr:hypothetical protein [Marivirga tractuosa]ADR22792.1 hypothetical protein Ftrac_2814 [Marivirga tractuosa DSM 4126]BDD16537.1 hypothetical protein MATR_33620 [Marivirga tractuosa]